MGNEERGEVGRDRPCDGGRGMAPGSMAGEDAATAAGKGSGPRVPRDREQSCPFAELAVARKDFLKKLLHHDPSLSQVGLILDVSF